MSKETIPRKEKPYQIFLEITKEDLKHLQKGNSLGFQARKYRKYLEIEVRMNQ